MSKFKTFDITLSKEGKGVQIDAEYEQLNIHSDQTNGYYAMNYWPKSLKIQERPGYQYNIKGEE